MKKPCKHVQLDPNCRLCQLYVTDPRYRILWSDDVVNVVATADGIGDALLGLTSCAGLKKQFPDKTLVYSLLGTSRKGAPWQLPFVKLFDGYDDVRLDVIPGVPAFLPHETYSEQNSTRLATMTRAEWYASACGTTPVLPSPRPLSPDAMTWAEKYKDAVVLAPFSIWQVRAWSFSHYVTLEKMLMKAGHRVVILDGRADDKTRTDVFSSPVLRDESAQRVAGVLSVASCFVGSDSGMSHLAGLLSVPSVVMSAQIKGERIFGLYPSVTVINGPLDCLGCHWQGQHGWQPRCDSLCANLQAIQPDSIFNTVVKKTTRTLLSQDRLNVLAETARLTSKLQGDTAEFGVYRGGSAKVIAEACPRKRVHLFDTFSGLPHDDADGLHKAGDFNTSLEEVKNYLAGHDVVFHVGIFPETAVDNLVFCMAHIDCDTYQSARAAIEYFWPRLVQDGCLLIDDYRWHKTPGIERAIRELLPDEVIEETAFIQCRIWKKTAPSTPILTLKGPAKGCCGNMNRPKT